MLRNLYSASRAMAVQCRSQHCSQVNGVGEGVRQAKRSARAARSVGWRLRGTSPRGSKPSGWGAYERPHRGLSRRPRRQRSTKQPSSAHVAPWQGRASRKKKPN